MHTQEKKILPIFIAVVTLLAIGAVAESIVSVKNRLFSFSFQRDRSSEKVANTAKATL